MIKSIKKLAQNTVNSIQGLKVALQEHSFLIELAGGVMLVPLLIFMNRSLALKFAVICAFLMLLAAELLNTAIERICNKITRDYDEDIRDIKDLASAAVFVVWMINAMLFFYYLFAF